MEIEIRWRHATGTVAFRGDRDTAVGVVGAALCSELGEKGIAVVGGVALIGREPVGDAATLHGSDLEFRPVNEVIQTLQVTLVSETGNSIAIDEAITRVGSGADAMQLTMTSTGLEARRVGSPYESTLSFNFGDEVEIEGVQYTLGAKKRSEDHFTQKLSAWSVQVVGGLEAGEMVPATSNSVVVGRRPQSVDLHVETPTVSARHFSVETAVAGHTVTDLDSTNGTIVDGVDVGQAIVQDGEIISAGDARFRIIKSVDSQPAAHRGSLVNGRVEYTTAPFMPRVDDRKTFRVPSRPLENDRPYAFPWATVISPVLMAGAMYIAFQRPALLIIAAAGPIIGIVNFVLNKRERRKQWQHSQRVYEEELAAVTAQIDEAVASEWSLAWELAPSAAVVGEAARVPTTALWQRPSEDERSLYLRIGTATQQSQVIVEGERAEEPRSIEDMPITIGMREVGVLAITGPLERSRAVGRSLVAQLATMRVPDSLSIICFLRDGVAAGYEHMPWLPHCVGDDGVPFVANTDEQRTHWFTELASEIDRRHEHGADGFFSKEYVLVLDRQRELRAYPDLPAILKRGPRVGIYTITIDGASNLAPPEALAEVRVNADYPVHASLHVRDKPAVKDIAVEGITVARAEQHAQDLARFHPADARSEKAVPSFVRFTDLHRVEAHNPSAIATEWRKRQLNTSTVVGSTAHSDLHIDIAVDGPHAVVAGSTGSGKTELVLTMCAGLALNNSPEALNFVVVDWKGGGDYVQIAALPHTTATISNLDDYLTQRAMTSLREEIRRRQATLERLVVAGVISEPKLDTVWKEDAAAGIAEQMPALIVIVDEFYELFQEQPEIVKLITSIATVGRSLGIHLLLATQSAGKVIRGQLDTNVGLRMVLRTDGDGNDDLVKSPAAQKISKRLPGRGLIRWGDPPHLVEFQTARVAGRRSDAIGADLKPSIHKVSWENVGYALPDVKSAKVPLEETDLGAIVDATHRARQIVEPKIPSSPVTRPLPDNIVLKRLIAKSPKTLTAPFGILDSPKRQARQVASFEPKTDGHLLCAGGSRSGRTTFLRTIAASLASQNSPDALHLQIIDFGSGELRALRALPHVGEIIERSDTEHQALFAMALAKEAKRRTDLHRSLNAISIEDQHRLQPDQPLARIVVIVDRWDNLVLDQPYDSEFMSRLLSIAQDGAALGMHLVATGDHRMLLSGKVGKSIGNRLILPLGHEEDYRGLVPDIRRLPPRRVGRAVTGDGEEVQIAQLSAGEATGASISDALEEIAQQSAPVQRAHDRFAVKVLPESVLLNDLQTAEGGRSVGVGGESNDTVSLDTTAFDRFIVAGPCKSGKSNTMRAMARAISADGTAVCLVCPKDSPLAKEAASPGTTLLPPEQLSVEALKKAVLAGEPAALLVDDIEQLSDESLSLLLDLEGMISEHPLKLVCAGDADSLDNNIVALHLKKDRSGILLRPQKSHGDLLGTSIEATTESAPSGRGLIVQSGVAQAIQVALVN